MFRNSHNSRGLSRRARNPASRWRIIIIALMLTLTVGSAAPTTRAQAGQALANPVILKASVAPAKPPKICVGQRLFFYVGMEKSIFKTIGEKEYDIAGDVKGQINASGKIVKGPGKLEDTVDIVNGQAVFIFSSDKRGDTTIRFTVKVTSGMIGAGERLIDGPVGREKDIQVKNENCKFKNTTIGEWTIPGEVKGHINATSNDAEVKAPDPQSSFTGSTSVNWVVSVGRARDCSGAVSIGSSKLDWNGTMDEGGQLTLNGNFQTAAGTFDVTCAGGGESFDDSMPVELTPDPVTLTIASSGGTINQAQTLEWEGANPGQITIVIFPVEDTGVARIPGFHAVSWNDLSGFFGALIALP